MPRLLPRLIDKVKLETSSQKSIRVPSLESRKKPKSLYRPIPLRPSFEPTEHSILLEPHNPVANSKSYARHKTLPPTLCRPIPKDSSQADAPRQMTEAEFGWWANPYLRMLSSPLRKCAISGRHLPSDLLVRLVPVRVPTSLLQRKAHPSQTLSVLVPDGLLHPKYTTRIRAGCSVYITCWRHFVQKTQRGFHNPASPGAVLTNRAPEQISHLLRLRVVQEFELLAERLEYAASTGKNQGTSDFVLRRLTKDEWGAMKSSGTLPYSNAVACLIVPPVNNDRETKQRPSGNMTPLPPTDGTLPPANGAPPKQLPPISTLLPAGLDAWDESLPSSLSLLKIPLYNGISSFPSRSQRAALHNILRRILQAERIIKSNNAKRRHSKSSDPGNRKASHAFLLCSDAVTARRGDPAAIARALWRLRMYESDGWIDNTQPIVSSN